MIRIVVPVLFSIAALFALAVAPPRSAAQDNPPLASLAREDVPECTNPDWDKTDVRPPDPQDAAVTPVITVEDANGTPTTEASQAELYLVVVTIPPGGCTPFDSLSNQRNGAVVWIVQQGKVLYAWQAAEGAAPGSTPIVERGNLVTQHDDPIGTPIPESEGVILYPGDWVIQDRLIDISLHNMGGDSAILLKAVYAEPTGGGGGCAGDCRG
jgi:hypothetical protein